MPLADDVGGGIGMKVTGATLGLAAVNLVGVEYAAFQRGPIWRGWQDAQVKEIRKLLEDNFKG